MIHVIFGKKGSGKTTLSKALMLKTGGRVVFLSPVETVNMKHIELWDIESIPDAMQNLNPGQIVLVRRADIEAMDVTALTAIITAKGYTVVIDEVDRYKESRELKDMIHYSRHFDINIIVNTRRYADVPRLLTSQADHLYIFQTNEPRDLDYIRSFCGRHFADKTQNLPLYTYLEYPSQLTGQSQDYGI